MNQEKEVRFDLYCSICKHAKLGEQDDPCFECLQHPSNIDSHKPVNFKEVEKNDI